MMMVQNLSKLSAYIHNMLGSYLLTFNRNESVPVAPAAVGLFSIPTQILAIYRAVSPYYYSRDASGNM